MPQRYLKHKINGKFHNEHRLVWEAAHGPIPDGYVIHHENEDKFDNRLENLRMMTLEDHSSLHRLKHPKIKTCEVCGVEYEPIATSRQKQRTCSRPCYRTLASRIATQREAKRRADRTAA